MKDRHKFTNNYQYKKKYLKYKVKLFKLKGGKCTRFSKKDCVLSTKLDRCLESKIYNINSTQKKCICNHLTRKCVKIDKKRGINTQRKLNTLL